jgi:hypothetical protein
MKPGMSQEDRDSEIPSLRQSRLVVDWIVIQKQLFVLVVSNCRFQYQFGIY